MVLTNINMSNSPRKTLSCPGFEPGVPSFPLSLSEDYKAGVFPQSRISFIEPWPPQVSSSNPPFCLSLVSNVLFLTIGLRIGAVKLAIPSDKLPKMSQN